MIDFVFPNEKEESYINIAEKLKTGVCFIYTIKDKDKITKTKEKGIKTAILTDTKFEKAKQMADFVIAKADENVRSIIERKQANFIYGFEETSKRDYMHYRNSGLNQVLCKLMAEKNITYLINIDQLNNSKDPQFLGRVLQNIRLCKKYKVNIQIATFAKSPYEMRSYNDINSLMKVLGAQQ